MTDRASTLKDVAGLAGVSTATVSRALNDPHSVSDEARARVLSAALTLRYHPNAHAIELARANGGTQRRRETHEASDQCKKAEVVIYRKSCRPITKPNADQMRLLEDENLRLKRLVAMLSIDLERVKELI